MANDEHLEILKQGAKVWNEWRENNSEIQPDLIGANLPDLKGANLSNADLTFANLFDANLPLVDFSNADLTFADLTFANLKGANLSGAYLYLATFRSTNLNGTDFTEAYVRSTLFADTDLSEAKGLETIKHGSPSTLGFDTLYKSKGKIPEVFLRGCGVPETLIDYFRNHPILGTDQLKCFVSYSTTDEDFTQKLDEKLDNRGVRCWRYQRDMKPGEEPRVGMRRGFDDSDRMLLCCSKESLSSHYVYEEITMALEKEGELFKRDGKRTNIMLVLDLDGHIFSTDCHHDLRTQIRTHQIIDFKGDFDQGLDNLLHHLRRE